jgi:hypothetical protein
LVREEKQREGLAGRFVVLGSPLNPPDSTGLLVRRSESLRDGKSFEGTSIGMDDIHGPERVGVPAVHTKLAR